MTNARRIELLAPAKNAEIGKEAILHGADAVYIGAPRFGARAAAGNSLDDLAGLVDFAHRFDARIYITFNTLLYDHELAEAERLIRQLYHIGVDALIVQDMGITRLDIPPIALHASTQTDNRTPEKVQFLERCGFSQVVLARELSLDEIRAISSTVRVPLEVFVHGALCVSYSGQCYLSQALCGRSANRGECAQYCRLPYTLVDGRGRIIARDKHLLSLRDLNQSDRLEELLDAGVTSLKIEGRLKEMAYVKNCTAYYRQALDRIFERRPEYRRSSSGSSIIDFTPRLEKSFNRGFTHYFLDGRTAAPIASPDTPKSLGERVGQVKQTDRNSFVVAGTASLHNGDGLCFVNSRGEFEGVRVNRAEGNRIYPASRIDIAPRTVLYRNLDFEFEKQLARPTADRRIGITMRLYTVPDGFALTRAISESLGDRARRGTAPAGPHPAAGGRNRNNWANWAPPSTLPHASTSPSTRASSSPPLPCRNCGNGASNGSTAPRRIACRPERRRPEELTARFPQNAINYLGNVSNHLAEQFYRDHGVTSIAPAFETKPVEGGTPHVHAPLHPLHAGILQEDSRRQGVARTAHPALQGRTTGPALRLPGVPDDHTARGEIGPHSYSQQPHIKLHRRPTQKRFWAVSLFYYRKR